MLKAEVVVSFLDVREKNKTEMKDEITEDDSEFNQVVDKDNILNENLSDEVEDESESDITTKNDENTDISDDNNLES